MHFKPCCYFLILLIVLFIFSAAMFAQKDARGIIAGQIVDGSTGDPLIGVNVLVKGTVMGTATDLDGNYRIKRVPVGQHVLRISYMGYETQEITEFQVRSGEAANLNVSMTKEVLKGEVVTVTAEAAKNTEAGLLKNRQKASAVSDAISAETISRTGSGDAAEAMTKVTGASIVDGKYVFVRGLGERYSTTHLNGAELPTADPDKKAFQLDLFPANLLDNIVTVKTFTPDKPGNFSGGVVDIGTKNFPNDFTLSASASAGYNTKASLNDNFILYQGGNTDWLGIDDGTRAIPDELINAEVPSKAIAYDKAYDFGETEMAEQLDRLSKSFNNTMAPVKRSGPLNQSYGFSIGNQIDLFDKPFGYIAGLTYSRSASYYKDGTRNLYKLSDDKGNTLNPQILLNDSQGKIESNWGGLFNLGYKLTPNHQLAVNTMYTRNGESKARYQEGIWPNQYGYDDSTHVFQNRLLQFTERELVSYQLMGEHHLSDLFGTHIHWNASTARNQQDEPDTRFFANVMDLSDTTYTSTHSGFRDPARYYRNMTEDNQNYAVDISIPFKQWNGLNSQFKFGTAYQNVERKFNERYFSIIYDTKAKQDKGYGTIVYYDGDPAAFFADSSMGVVRVDTSSKGQLKYVFGNYLSEANVNNYSGDLDVFATYAMLEMPLTPMLRLIGGIRYETTDMMTQGQDTTGKIDTQDLLPSVNLVYMLNSNMNLRAAYTKTLARPTFREFAPYESFEFIMGNYLIGNIDLKRTLISNFDLRWEYFMRPGEIVALSGFYKLLDSPIERTMVGGTNGQIEYKNVDEAVIYGIEFEARKRLDVLHDMLGNFSIGGNFSWTNSRVDIAPSELLERQKINPDASDTRELQGQSPYLLNLDFAYDHYQTGSHMGLHFNTFGKRLSSISMKGTPDVFEQSRPILNLTASKKLTKSVKFKVSVKNLLDSEHKESYEYKGNEFVYYQYQLGRSFSIGLSYSQ